MSSIRVREAVVDFIIVIFNIVPSDARRQSRMEVDGGPDARDVKMKDI